MHRTETLRETETWTETLRETWTETSRETETLCETFSCVALPLLIYCTPTQKKSRFASLYNVTANTGAAVGRGGGGG